MEAIRKALKWLTVATVVLYVGVCGIAVKTYIDASRNTHALCAIRHNVEKRVAQSDKFLEDHPNGFAGVSKKKIEISLQNDRNTIVALQEISCK